MVVTHGTDPEWFIVDPKGQPSPAWRHFPPKAKAMVLKQYNGWGELKAFYDGFAVELNTPARMCREELAMTVLTGIDLIREKLPTGYKLVSSPAMAIDLKDMLRDCPTDALIFGCEPSWNAYTGEFEGVALDATEHPFRYGGGHYHISIPRNDYLGRPVSHWMADRKQVAKYIKLIDRYVGLPLSILFNKPETFLRRKYYGKAGEYRLQDYGGTAYGIEYRTPGPEVWNAPPIASWVGGVMRAVAMDFETLIAQPQDRLLEAAIRRAINTGRGLEALLPKCYYHWNTGFSDIHFKKFMAQRPFQNLLEFSPEKARHTPIELGMRGWDRYSAVGSELEYHKLLYVQPPVKVYA